MSKLVFVSENQVANVLSDAKNKKGRADIPKLADTFYGFLHNNKIILNEILEKEPDFKWIAECLNVNLRYEKLPKGIGGFPFKKSDEYFIILNKNLDLQKRMHSFFHELFHIFLGDMSKNYILFEFDEEYLKDSNETHYRFYCIIMKLFKFISIVNKKNNDFFMTRGGKRLISSFFRNGSPLSKKDLQGLLKILVKIYESKLLTLVERKDEIMADRLTEELLRLIQKRKENIIKG